MSQIYWDVAFFPFPANMRFSAYVAYCYRCFVVSLLHRASIMAALVDRHARSDLDCVLWLHSSLPVLLLHIHDGGKSTCINDKFLLRPIYVTVLMITPIVGIQCLLC